MDPLEQKSKLAVLMELMKSADDAEASKLSPEPEEPVGMDLAADLGDAGDAKLEAEMPTDEPKSDMDPAEMQKLMALYESLK